MTKAHFLHTRVWVCETKGTTWCRLDGSIFGQRSFSLLRLFFNDQWKPSPIVKTSQCRRRCRRRQTSTSSHQAKPDCDEKSDWWPRSSEVVFPLCTQRPGVRILAFTNDFSIGIEFDVAENYKWHCLGSGQKPVFWTYRPATWTSETL